MKSPLIIDAHRERLLKLIRSFKKPTQKPKAVLSGTQLHLSGTPDKITNEKKIL